MVVTVKKPKRASPGSLKVPKATMLRLVREAKNPPKPTEKLVKLMREGRRLSKKASV